MFSCFLLAALLLQPVYAIWPQPNSMSRGTGLVRVDLANFEYKLDVVPSLEKYPDLARAMTLSKQRIKTDNLPFLSVDRGYNNTAAVKAANYLSAVALRHAAHCTTAFDDISTIAVLKLEERDESYNLDISSDGAAFIEACNALGLFRGMTTFEQLVYVLPKTSRSTAASGIAYIQDTPIHIEDYAEFAWRGLLLDTSRNFYPVASLKKMLDVMSFAKFSQFHWHVTDSQSWPLQIGVYPNLTNAAYDTESIYSQKDVTDVISYANSIAIDVVIEVDTPAHTASLVEAFPDIIDCYMDDWTTYALEPEAGQLNIASKKSVEVVKDIFSDVMSRKTYTSTFFSPGGDELNIACYNKHNDPATFESTLHKFTTETYAEITKHKKTPYVWQDMLVTHSVGLNSTDALIAVWTDSSVARQVADMGSRLVHAPADYMYLDCGQGDWIGNSTGPSWCDPYKSWQRILSFDPYANLTQSQRSLVAGGQVCLWSEQSGRENLETQCDLSLPLVSKLKFKVWPRAAALSEVFWNKATATERDLAEALPRLHDFRYRLVQRGVAANPIAPHFCALRPHACDWMGKGLQDREKSKETSTNRLKNLTGLDFNLPLEFWLFIIATIALVSRR